MFCLHFDWLLGIFPPNFPPHFPPFICVFHCLTESRHNRNQSYKWPKQVGKKSNLLDLYRIGYKSNLLDFSRVESRLSRVERRQRHFLPVCACHTQTETETETQVSRRRLHLTRCGHVAVVSVAVVAAHLHAGYRLPATSVRPSPSLARHAWRNSSLSPANGLATNQIRMRLQLVVGTCSSFLKHPHICIGTLYILKIIEQKKIAITYDMLR